MGTIIGYIMLGFCAIGIIITSFVIVLISIDLYFLNLKIEKHPKLLAIIENTLQKICDEEGIKFFHKTFEEINANTPENNDKVVGRYVYTIDQEYQQKINKSLAEIEVLETKYKMPYKKLCAFVGYETPIDKENYVLPRIQLCDDELKKYGMISYYTTFFHELGHHFAVKEIGSEHNENDANIIGDRLINQRLPYYFRLFFGLRCRLEKDELTWKEKLVSYIGYLKYLKTEKWQ
jgi:hypothetical protein